MPFRPWGFLVLFQIKMPHGYVRACVRTCVCVYLLCPPLQENTLVSSEWGYRRQGFFKRNTSKHVCHRPDEASEPGDM